MTASKTKNPVSIRQLIMLFTFIIYSPMVRFLPGYAAEHAQEAAWVSPWFAVIPMIALIFLMHTILNKSNGKSIPEFIVDILGKYFGKLALFVHLLWVTFLFSFYLRISGERMVSTIYPNVNITFFLIATLVVVSVIVRSGATTIARMGEIQLPILLIMFLFTCMFLFPKIRADAILPVYFNDIGNIFRASVGSVSASCYLFLLLLFSDHIVGKKNLKKSFVKGVLLISCLSVILLLVTIGTLGSSVTTRATIPFLLSSKQVSVLDTIENIESIVIATWLLTDTLLLSFLAIVFLNISKHLFMLLEPNRLINILFVFLFIFSLGIASNRMELVLLSKHVMDKINLTIGYGTPILLFAVGKLRRKL